MAKTKVVNLPETLDIAAQRAANSICNIIADAAAKADVPNLEKEFRDNDMRAQIGRLIATEVTLCVSQRMSDLMREILDGAITDEEESDAKPKQKPH